jgi:hypothetical protein
MKIALCALAISFVAVGLTGCYGNETPELRGMAMTKKEFKNNRRTALNQNVREANDEISRVLLLDNPSHLSPFPVVDTSGMPR